MPGLSFLPSIDVTVVNSLMRTIPKKRQHMLYMTSFGHMMGGGQWSLYYLIRHLNKDVFYPILLCPEEGELADKMRGAGAELIFLDIGRIRYLNPLVIKRLVNIIKDKQIDLIHTDSTTEAFYAGIAAWVTRIPVVWHIRVSEKAWFIDRILATLSTKLILVSNAIRKRFAWLNDHQKMVVIHNGIDLETFDNFPGTSSIREDYNIAQDTLLLGCIGRIEKRKGQEYLISAMRHLDNAKLILVGQGKEDYLNRITKLCNEFNIADRVMYIGYRDDIPSVLKEIDIFVFPTLRGEGFPRVILEAMAAGKPVVATDNAGSPEAVADGYTGFIVPTGNTSALATKLKELIADKKKRTVMGEAGRKRVKKYFTIQKNVEKIQQVYHDILEIG